jgi:hypothetical protein
MIKKQAFLLVATLLLLSWSLSAQNSFYGGFKAGMNFATIDGPLDLGNNDQELESYSYTTGFHVGVNFNVNLTDYFGLRGEVIYGQKGAEYDFSSQSSFMPFYRIDEMGNIMASGTRNTKISITNTYLDLPVSAFIRFGRLELSGGLSLGVLVSSRAVGEVIFNGVSPQGENINNVVFIVDGSYFDSDAFDVNNPGNSEETRIDGRRVVIPESIGTYYDNPNPDKSLFNTLDASVQGGLSFYLNQGLFISFKGYYGLSDITRNEADYSVLELNDDQSLIFKSDDDRNITLQASVGFHF